MKDSGNIWAVILAAGESTRMNGPKLILPYGNSTIIKHLVENILGSGISHIRIVLGAWRDEIMKATKGLPVSFCINEDYKRGMLSSVICGVDSLPPDSAAAMIFPGDQPGISPEVIDSLIARFNECGRGIIVAVSQGKRGHPLLVRRKYFKAVKELRSDKGLKELMVIYKKDVEEVETNDVMILRDIDTREEYIQAISKSK